MNRLNDAKKRLEPDSFFIITDEENYEKDIAKYSKGQLRKAHIIKIVAKG